MKQVLGFFGVVYNNTTEKICVVILFWKGVQKNPTNHPTFLNQLKLRLATAIGHNTLYLAKNLLRQNLNGKAIL